MTSRWQHWSLLDELTLYHNNVGVCEHGGSMEIRPLLATCDRSKLNLLQKVPQKRDDLNLEVEDVMYTYTHRYICTTCTHMHTHY